MIQRPPRSTRTDTLFPYTTLFRSVAADLHLLSGKVVVRQVELEGRVAREGRPREAPRYLAQRFEGQPGHALVAVNVGDLLVVAQRLQVIGVGDVTVSRVQLAEAVAPDDHLVRQDERRRGHECVSTCSYRWAALL